jgi:nucleoid-associated protein Lsr2
MSHYLQHRAAAKRGAVLPPGGTAPVPRGQSMKGNLIVAVHTRTVLTDDFDASTDGVTSHEFAFDGVTWEIDLSVANLDRLREALRPFQAAGRRLPASRAGRPTARTRADDRADTKAMRRWWLDNRDRDDLPPFASHGRIPAAVTQAYRDAHQPQQADPHHDH